MSAALLSMWPSVMLALFLIFGSKLAFPFVSPGALPSAPALPSALLGSVLALPLVLGRCNMAAAAAADAAETSTEAEGAVAVPSMWRVRE